MRQSNASGVRNDLIQIMTTLLSAPYQGVGLLPISFVVKRAIGPHGFTTRKSYTVPPNKVAMVKSISMSLVRTAAGGGSGEAISYVGIIPNGGAQIDIAVCHYASNNLDIPISTNLSCEHLLVEGDEIMYETADLSGAGIVQYHCAVSIQEIDAPI